MNLDKYIWSNPDTISQGMASRDEEVRTWDNEIHTDAIVELNAMIADDPKNPELYLAKGISLSRATLHHQEAIDAFSYGLTLAPFHSLLYRWRGHKYINVRQFNRASADLELAARLDPSNWDVWYHLALAHYCNAEFDRAEEAYMQCWTLPNTKDSLVAIADWLYMTLRRQGKDDRAAEILAAVDSNIDLTADWAIDSYFPRIRLYKGELQPSDLLDGVNRGTSDFVTLGYGLGNYFYYNGEQDKAVEVWKEVVRGDYWSALGYVAAETELKRRGDL
ncbi:MAG: hypothetical protein M9953_09255 [Thermomicrobiales bacterium]|nr:hypothetical protein [Thermomicrobiales bacterium]